MMRDSEHGNRGRYPKHNRSRTRREFKETPDRPEAEEISSWLLAMRELDRIERNKAFIGVQLGPEHASQRTVRDLVSGVTRMKRYLDFLIKNFYRGDAKTLEQSMRTALRVGLYALLFTRQPDHAVLNETVEAAKRHVRPGAGGLTNGILRNALRQKDDLPEPEGELAHRLAVTYSHPTWMIKRWLALWGEEAVEALLRHNNERPRFGLHISRDHEEVKSILAEANVAFERSTRVEGMIRLSTLQPLLKTGRLKDGTLQVQDEAAALVVEACHVTPGMRILDLCAAPGGKTIRLARATGPEGSVMASDSHAGRLELVSQNADRHQQAHVDIKEADGRELPDEWHGQFDLVLLDAPCTGYGVFSKRADMRWNRSPEDEQDLIELQRQLLEQASLCVKPGGALVYSTCTLGPAENEDQVSRFLERHPAFTRESVADVISDDLVTPSGAYESLPHKTGLDGAYAARLRRSS